GVEVREVAETLAPLPHQPEAGQQEGAGEALESVDGVAVSALGTGRRDARVVRRGVGACARQQTVGIACPGGAIGENGCGRRDVATGLLTHPGSPLKLERSLRPLSEISNPFRSWQELY